MKGRFDASLREMRRPKMPSSFPDAQTRWNRGLAERLASDAYSLDFHPERWQREFDRALCIINGFVSEYGGAK